MKLIPFFTRLFSYSLVTLLLLSCTFTPWARQQPPSTIEWPVAGWRSTTPEEQGIDSAKVAEALLAMRAQQLDIHSFLLIRHGKVVVDATFYPYDGESVHNVASVTKSILTTLVSIAVEQDKLSLDEPMISFFPEYQITNLDVRKERVTVGDLASMVNGMESMCKENDEGTLQEMMASPDFLQFALDRKMSYEPGTHFCYDSPGMHLLGAVLQEATGMPLLDFARQNLFEPLGIQVSLWESDPQGFYNGWGDIYLHPHDMAKIGYLWLTNGKWAGKQIVPTEWIKKSVTPQASETFEDSEYGYGWWLEGGDELTVYVAAGRGGQYIKIVPEWDIIAVTTGGGFEFWEIDPLILPALVDMENPLPANAEGLAQLESAVAQVTQPPAAQPVAPLPAIARKILGKTFVFDPNPTKVETLMMEFDDSAEAILHYKLFGNDATISVPVGLDGIYRTSVGDHGLPKGYRGYWADDDTFVLEYDGIATNDHIFYHVRFEGDRVLFSVQETAHEGNAYFEGRLLKP